MDGSALGASAWGVSTFGGSEGRFLASRAEFRTGGSRGVIPGNGKSPRPSSSSKIDIVFDVESGLLEKPPCMVDELGLDLTECDAIDPEFFLLPMLATGTVNGGIVDCFCDQ